MLQLVKLDLEFQLKIKLGMGFHKTSIFINKLKPNLTIAQEEWNEAQKVKVICDLEGESQKYIASE